MDAITALNNVDFLSVLISVFIILIAVKTIVSVLEWCATKLGLELKWVRNRKEEHELLIKTSEEVNSIKKDVTETINKLSDKVEKLSEQSRKYELSDTRDTILQAHRYFANKHTNPSLAWTEMESHGFWEQFDTYVSLGGDDYVHSDVEPDMRSLILIPMSDTDGIDKLMESRYKKC